MKNQLFQCPKCHQVLPYTPPCSCGFILREANGIILLMTDEERAARQPFLDAYDQIRRNEGWGDDDLDLPFHPRRHHAIWEIRRRTFQKLQTIVVGLPRGTALDIGAGNCWLTRYLDRWGFDAIASDINLSARDGLEAGQKYIDEGSRFLRIQASMERLPVAPDSIGLIVVNGAFHYTDNFQETIEGFRRALIPGGTLVIVDSPFYQHAAVGERMLSERITEFKGKFGMSKSMAGTSRYLTFDGIQGLAAFARLNCQVHHVWPGLRRSYRAFHRRLFGQRPAAQFPLVIMKK